jgi:hypothetical protein
MELLLSLAKLDCLLLFLSLLFNSSGALLSQDLGYLPLFVIINLPHDSYYVTGSLTKIGGPKEFCGFSFSSHGCCHYLIV